MKVWSIANQKGGVGKTTTTLTLGGMLVEWGYRTLLVDWDPHGSLTAYFGFDPDTLVDSVYSLFEAGPEICDFNRLVRETGTEQLWLLPASTAMATLDRQLGAREGMGLVLAKALERVSACYDYVLVDCAPTLGVLMENALGACQQLLVPVQTEYLALKGLERMEHTLGMIQRSRQSELPWLILPTMFDRRTRASNRSLLSLRQRYGFRVWGSVIPVDTLLREASNAGQPISHYAPGARGAIAYRELLHFMLGIDGPLPRAVSQ